MDFSPPLDAGKLAQLERVIEAMYSGTTDDRRIADSVLRGIKDKDDGWLLAESILATSANVNLRFFAVSLLEDAIKLRWRLFSAEQKSGIKGYLVTIIVKMAAEEQAAQKHLLAKLNDALVQVVKNEWPTGWPDFISEICASGKSNQALCENNLRILAILSEEVFEFGKETMTARKAGRLCETLSSQFSVIFELCTFVLSTHASKTASVKPSLVTAALATLQRFICFIHRRYIFETDLVSLLINHFLEPSSSRIECLKCLSEIFGLREIPREYAQNYIAFFQKTLEKLSVCIPENLNAAGGAQNKHYWDVVINQTVLLLVNAVRSNAELIHEALPTDAFRFSVSLVLRFSYLPGEEIFKGCLDYWLLTTPRFYEASKPKQVNNPLLLTIGGNMHGDEKLAACRPLLSQLRRVIIARMAKPPEVVIRETEDGEIVREDELDTDELAVYRTMREILVYLTNLDNEDTDTALRTVLKSFIEYTMKHMQQGDSDDNWSSLQLNRLCWAVGSISGALPEEREKAFLVEVLQQLLKLCELKKTKASKAIVASNLLYVIGQYPRFLKAHWKFLKTLVIKLFEFLHETFPGVQETAVATLLKISDKCRKKLAVLQPGEHTPFIEDIIQNVQVQTRDLSDPLHLCTFYESAGVVISSVENVQTQELYIATLLHPLNQSWSDVISRAQGDMGILKDLNALRTLSLVLRIHERLAYTNGLAYGKHLNAIYLDMLQVYRIYSESVAQAAATSGSSVMSWEHIKLMRKVKRDCLRLVVTFVDRSVTMEKDKASVSSMITNHILPPLLDPVLGDYSRSIPQSRDAEVLALLSAITKHLTSSIIPAIPQVFDLVFSCTLEMLKADEFGYPEHREAFFELLCQVNRHCFRSLFLLPHDKLALFIESIIFGMRQHVAKIADTASVTLLEFLENLHKEDASICNSFYGAYYRRLLNEVFTVLTDRMHKAGLANHTRILALLVQIVNRGAVSDAVIGKQQAMEHLMDVLTRSFTTVTKPQLEAFILGLFAKSEQPHAFTELLKDFLISLKQFTGDEDTEEYERDKVNAIEQLQIQAKMDVPGMAPPDAYLADSEGNEFD